MNQSAHFSSEVVSQTGFLHSSALGFFDDYEDKENTMNPNAVSLEQNVKNLVCNGKPYTVVQEDLKKVKKNRNSVSPSRKAHYRDLRKELEKLNKKSEFAKIADTTGVTFPLNASICAEQVAFQKACREFEEKAKLDHF